MRQHRIPSINTSITMSDTTNDYNRFLRGYKPTLEWSLYFWPVKYRVKRVPK